MMKTTEWTERECRRLNAILAGGRITAVEMDESRFDGDPMIVLHVEHTAGFRKYLQVAVLSNEDYDDPGALDITDARHPFVQGEDREAEARMARGFREE